MPWVKHHRCECGYREKMTFGSTWYVRDECCPRCGRDKTEMREVTERRVYCPTLLNPFRFKWEEASNG